MLEIATGQAATLVGVSTRQFRRYLRSENSPPRQPNGLFRTDKLGRWLKERLVTKALSKALSRLGELNGAYERARRDKEMADRLAQENEARPKNWCQRPKCVRVGTRFTGRQRGEYYAYQKRLLQQSRQQMTLQLCTTYLNPRFTVPSTI